ncbi:MAG: hypothetical protein P8170_13275 [Gemmatimonadota bacterium]|jgi:hypothetical protein
MDRYAATTTMTLLALIPASCTPDSEAPDGGDPATEPTPAVAEAPPGTDIWLAPLSRDEGGRLSIGEPVGAVQRPGYDNQPHFLPDGSGFWFTSIDDAGQADIRYYDLATGRVDAVTTTAPESEYSATPLESGDGFSAIRVEADSTQRLWRFSMDGSGGEPVFESIAPVGYHAWADEETVVMFVLGQPATLQVGDVGSGQARVVAEDIGRSIRRIPGSSQVSYVQRRGEGMSEIRRLFPETGESELLAEGVQGGDYHAWTPEGILLQAHGARLYAWDPSVDDAVWEEIADLSALGIELTRLAVSPDGTTLALVGEPTR